MRECIGQSDRESVCVRDRDREGTIVRSMYVIKAEGERCAQ